MFSFLATVLAFVTTYYLPVLGVYLAGGILYAILMWLFKAYKLRTRITGLADSKELGSVEMQRLRQVRYLYGYDNVYPPKVSQNKGKLFGWALFWPIHLIYTMLHDVAVESFTWVYNKFGGMLQSVSDRILPK